MENLPLALRSTNKQQVLEFIFTAHLNLFNIRRDHEWQVIIGALVLLGAVDWAILETGVVLATWHLYLWWCAIFVLFVCIGWYQWGVQIRNRVDRVVMDRILHHMCDAINVEADSSLRVGIDREDEKFFCTAVDPVLRLTYLWAFAAQMVVLLIASLISAAVPYF